MKIVMLAANLLQAVVNLQGLSKLRPYVDVEKVFHFAFDCSILMAMWYLVLFNKSVSSTSFIGPKRLPYHILSISSSLMVALVDSVMHECEPRIYLESAGRDCQAFGERGDNIVGFYYNVARWAFYGGTIIILAWTRYKLYS